MKRKALKMARQWQGVTQQALAAKVGCKEHDICLIETGRITPMPSLALRISKALSCDIIEIFPELGISNSEVSKLSEKEN